MSRAVLIAFALVLLLAPIFAALPDDTTQTQTAWASLLSALVMGGVLVAAVGARRGARRDSGEQGQPPPPAVVSFAVLLGLALLSMLVRLVTQHSRAYLDLMLRGWGVLAVEFALFVLCRRLARSARGALYLLVGAAVVGSAVLSSIGVNEYLLRLVAHQASARVFATSTPDFAAGYLVLLLPPTLALFLGAPAEKRLPLLFGLVIVLQMGTLLTTGSRFALVSLVVAFVVFAGSLAYAVRCGLPLDAPLRRRIIGIAVVIALAALGGARPILERLHSGASQENSGAFRIWTWRGAARMAAANPLLGAGVGAWIDTYPRYALTGFTRLAHNSYLQLADDCGIPAVLALAATLGLVGVAGARGLRRPLPVLPVAPPPPGDLLAAVAPPDDRLLLCGLLGSMAAGVVQNLIDSDWYVFFIGITFWALAGLTLGVTGEALPVLNSGIAKGLMDSPRRSSTPLAPFAWGAVGAILLLLFVSQGVAAWFGYQAQTAADPGAARDAYQTACLWDPLSARYPAELGARVEARVGSAVTAELLLRTATHLEPSATNFRRLGTVLDSAGENAAAAAAYRNGLRVDPNSLDLLLALAKDSPPPQALSLYRRVAALEDSPVGRVRAIGEITEARFAIADTALGDAAAAAGNAGEATRCYGRAQRRLEAYLDEGGTENAERQVQSGNHPDPAADTQFRDLYARALDGLAAALPAEQKTTIQDRAHGNGLRFQAVIDAAQGDTAATPAEAMADYQRAATEIESYAAKAPAQNPGDPKGGLQMRGLYQHVLDALTGLSPTDGQAAVRAREQMGLQKFSVAFPGL